MAVLAVSPLALLSCKQARSEEEAKDTVKVSFPVIHPQVMDVPYERLFAAEIQCSEHLQLKACSAGVVEEVLVSEGQHVTRGQHLFTVGGREMESDLKRSLAERDGNAADLKIAEVELRNTLGLFAKKIVSEPEKELAEAKVASAAAKLTASEAQVAQAELKLSQARVSAPSDGIISRIPNKAGSRVDEGELLTEFSNRGDAYAYFYVSEKDSLGLIRDKRVVAPGAVTLELADGSVYTSKGQVDSWDSVVSKETGSIAFRARFSNPDGILKHGGSGRITLGVNVPDALVIPQRSTFEVQHKLCVYVVDKDDVVQMRTIVPQFRLPNCFVVQSGLQADDRVLYEGIQQVKEGEIVLADVRDASQLGAF